MNREIIFRLWDKDTQKLYADVGLTQRDNKPFRYSYEVTSRHIMEPVYKIYSKPDKYELMQYIGVKDLTGKKIFEGDIVSISCLYKVDLPGIVGFHEARYVVFSRCPERTVEHVFTEVEVNCKIFGNMYENPELLEEERE